MKTRAAFLLLMCAALSSFSQGTGLILHDIKLPDGFSDRVITFADKDTAIFADRENMLWIGTDDGLIRFDLSTWTTTLVGIRNAGEGSPPSELTISSITLGYRFGEGMLGSKLL